MNCSIRMPHSLLQQAWQRQPGSQVDSSGLQQSGRQGRLCLDQSSICVIRRQQCFAHNRPTGYFSSQQTTNSTSHSSAVLRLAAISNSPKHFPGFSLYTPLVRSSCSQIHLGTVGLSPAIVMAQLSAQITFPSVLQPKFNSNNKYVLWREKGPVKLILVT